MSSRHELFQAAHQAHIDWQTDRPLIDKFNHSDLKVALKLLGDEIEELNGGDHSGIFSAENIKKDHRTREDYRQQEISDILVFGMTAFDEMGLAIPIDSIYAKVGQIAQRFQFDLPEVGKPMDRPEALSDEKNKVYQILRQLLNDEAEFVLSFDDSKREKLPTVLEDILAYSIAMHSLIGVDSGKAVIEKIARNMIKYPASMFALPKEELSPEELEAFYHRQRKISATLFDGEVDQTTGERPKKGTGEFYQPQEEAEIELGELRPIGIWYRAAAQVIASTYGFSVKVSSLLNRNRT
ncbi:hypothetical protein KJZ63_03005 [Patescibacteria group bacterium]|nr:hypothetical protein [Patescibacteria group bacterium]